MGLFDSIRVKKPKRNNFNLTHDVKLTGRFGQLIPFMCEPVVPGDTFKCQSDVLLRLAPLVAPMMHRVKVYTHYFFVPNRLVWDNWRDFITGGEDGNSSPSYPRIKFENNGSWQTKESAERSHWLGVGSLADYLGFPIMDRNSPILYRRTGSQSFSAHPVVYDELPFRAYQLIYNEYYRDENLDAEVEIHKDEDGIRIFDNVVDTYHDLFKIRSRAWRKDYFTSALPWPQRGEDVVLPLRGDADIYSDDDLNVSYHPNINRNPATIKTTGGAGVVGSGNIKNSGGDITTESGVPIQVDNSDVLRIDKSEASKLKVDISTTSSATINELRRAIRAQEFLERDARGGSRYIEQILSHFGVRSSDARLQRPEFLGGGVQNLNVGEVLSTADTEGAVLATPAGNAFAIGRNHAFKRFFEEHGMIIGIISILPEASYMQGMPRKFSKFDRLDYYWPTFAHLGEQEVLSKELYYQGDNVNDDDDVFGYQSRYSEYKYIPNSIHGDFRTSLNSWHLGRIFGNKPLLNSSFIHYNPDDAERIFAVEDADVDKCWIQIVNKVKALRPMPVFGTPKL